MCDYDVCKNCGINNGGIEIPVPPGNLFCNNDHRMSMLYAPEPIQIRNGRSLYCDLCRAYISDLDAGYFRCGTKCNYDVCRDCGLRAGVLDTDVLAAQASIKIKKE